MALLIGGTLAYLFLPYPWWLVAVVGLALFELAEGALMLSLWRRFRGRRPAAGPEALVGEHGVLAAPGRVRIRGTSYPARVLDGARPDDRVIVEDVDGMTLVVRRSSD